MAITYKATFRPKKRKYKETGELIESNVPLFLDLSYLGRSWYNTGIRLKHIDDFDVQLQKLKSGKRALENSILSPEFKRNSWVLSLDENLIFHDTGQRVPIRKLSLSSQNSNKITPKDYPDSDHFTFLDSIFSTEDCSYSQKDLNALIQKRFDISDKPARGFISYYEEMEWIFNESTTPTLNKYKLKNPQSD